MLAQIHRHNKHRFSNKLRAVLFLGPSKTQEPFYRIHHNTPKNQKTIPVDHSKTNVNISQTHIRVDNSKLIHIDRFVISTTAAILYA